MTDRSNPYESGAIAHTGTSSVANSAYPRENPDGDFWWVYTRPSGASGTNVMTAYLRTLGSEDDIITPPSTLQALYLDIDTTGITLAQWQGGNVASSSAITTDDDTPYLIHAHVVGSTVIVRRGELGGPMETILSTDNAPLQVSDRFVLTTANSCIVDDVNIGNFKVEYTYDALGRRIERRIDNGGTQSKTRFIYDGAHVAEEWDIPATGNPTLEASYVYGLYVDDVLTMRRGGTDYYYHADDMGNVVKLTDSDGEVVEGYDYRDYGAPEFYDASGALTSATASALGNPYLFNGRRWDQELGYYYYRNRYMDPVLGRFTSRDPIGLWGDPLNLGNPFTYCASSPWSLLDPFGLSPGKPGGNAGGTALNDRLAGYAQGNLDFGLSMIGRGVDLWYGQINPMHRSNNLLATSVGLWNAASNPAETAERVSNDFSNYVENFSDRDLGRLAPEVSFTVAGALLGGGAFQAGSKVGILGRLGRSAGRIPGGPRLFSRFGSWWKDVAGEWRGWKNGFADTGAFRWEGRNGMRNTHASRLNAEPHDNIHHRIIAQGGTRGGGAGKLTLRGFFGEQYGRYVPNFIKNTRWNVTNFGQPNRLGGTGLHEALHRTNPDMPLNIFQRIWYGTNSWDKAIIGGSGLGTGIAISSMSED